MLRTRDPDAFQPDLAISLNSLGGILSYLGQREPALTATREAVDLRRTLAMRNPDAFQSDLATSLNNLGGMLSDLGQREAALVATREAVDLRRTLAMRNPDAFQPDLASSMNNRHLPGQSREELGRPKQQVQRPGTARAGARGHARGGGSQPHARDAQPPMRSSLILRRV